MTIAREFATIVLEMRFEKMLKNKVKQGWHSDHARSESFNVGHVDGFILNPTSSHELVQRLYTNPAWKITCKAPSLVIFIRSESEGIDGCTEKTAREEQGGYVWGSGLRPHPHTYRSSSRS